MQFQISERDPPHIHGHNIENLEYLFENPCLATLERGEMPNARRFMSGESWRFDRVFSAVSQSFCDHENL